MIYIHAFTIEAAGWMERRRASGLRYYFAQAHRVCWFSDLQQRCFLIADTRGVLAGEKIGRLPAAKTLFRCYFPTCIEIYRAQVSKIDNLRRQKIWFWTEIAFLWIYCRLLNSIMCKIQIIAVPWMLKQFDTKKQAPLSVCVQLPLVFRCDDFMRAQIQRATNRCRSAASETVSILTLSHTARRDKQESTSISQNLIIGGVLEDTFSGARRQSQFVGRKV